MSSKKFLLIVSCKEDPHVDYVIDKFNQVDLGQRVIRLNTEDLITNVKFTFDGTLGSIFIADSARHINTDEIGSVWYRRPDKPLYPPNFPPATEKFVTSQVWTVLNGFYHLTADSAVWINPRPTAAMSSNKIKQLQMAQSVGFCVPETLITNDVDQANHFLDTFDEVCIKSLDSSSPTAEGITYPFHTARLTAEEKSNNLALVAHCPTLFQRFIHKAFDLRVTVFGNKVYAVEIHSQARSESEQDFRLVSPTLLEHRIHKLPAQIEKKILTFMRYFDLRFSAMDFAVTADGDYYFLENNPNGQWLWLEDRTGIPISAGLMALVRSSLDD